MQIQDLWQELNDQQAAKISGGDCTPGEGCLASSIGFSDVVRPGSSRVPGTIIIFNNMSEGTIPPPSGKIRGTLLF